MVSLSTFTTQIRVLITMRKQAMENFVEKQENASNHQSLLLP